MPPAARAASEQGPPITNEYGLPAGVYAPPRAPSPEQQQQQAAAPRQQEASMATGTPAPTLDPVAAADARLRLMRENTTRRIGETIVFVFLAMVAVVMV